MAKPTKPATATDAQVRALLERYQCPVPFHAVRTRFLGTIASPDPHVSPMKTVESLWGGELPAFDSVEEASELVNALLMGLWDRLTSHQQRSAAFRLTRIDVPATREGLATIALLREQELTNFREGLFGDNASLDLPERATKALGILSELGAMIAGIRELAENPAKPVTPTDAADLLQQFRELTRIAEHEIHEAVLSCTRARRAMPPGIRPVVH
jgi:hypothetical protein